MFLIVDYITYQLQNERAADSFREFVSKTVRSLETFPLRYAVVAKNIRKVTVKNFYIFYSVDEQLKIVNILHILYKGMDISKICD